MRVSPQPRDVRELVARTFAALIGGENWFEELDETILLQEGRYMARSYRVDGFMAMWLIDVGLLQFYDEEGNMLRTINLLETTEPIRAAA